jgi:hypothetical protein
MAIFVSNPTSAAPPPLITEGQDPTVLESVEGFTEELAAAMLVPSAEPIATGKGASENPETPEKKLSDLQILPAEVLKNAVGDANFALAAQANTATAAALLEASPASDKTDAQTSMEEVAALDVSANLQAAELAAANLAAQLSANSVPTSPVPQASVEALELGAVTSKAANDLKTESALPSVGAGLNSEPVISNSSVNPSLQDSQLSGSLPRTKAPSIDAVAQQAIESSRSVGELPLDLKQLESKSSTLGSPLQSQANLAANDLASQTKPNLTPNSATLNAALNSAMNAAPTEQPASVQAQAQMVDAQSASSNSVAIVQSESKAAALAVAALNTDSTSVDASSNSQAAATGTEESAFKFDAKISQAELATPPKSVSNTSTNALNNAPTNAPTNAAPSLGQSASAIGQSRANVMPETVSATGGASDTQPLSAVASRSSSDVNPSQVSFEEPRPVATQSLEDLSSSFVSSLVGGAPRPVNTVMDLISMQAQERPLPVVPHEVRLDSGAVQLEIQKMVKQGGGHVVMELTPPDQSKFTIELKLDEQGGALLIVEGVSDSTRTRLEQSAPQLREQFQQMGLELQLDMRQNNQSASSNMSNFADSQDRGNQTHQGIHPKLDPTNPLTQREMGILRARETGSNQVYLYA